MRLLSSTSSSSRVSSRADKRADPESGWKMCGPESFPLESAVLLASDSLSSVVSRHSKPLTYGLSIADNKDVSGTFYGEADIARELGVKPQTVQVYRRRGKVPTPDAQTVAGRPLWREETVKRWLEARK